MRDHVDHECAGVRRGDEEDRHEKNRETRKEAARGHRLEHLEECEVLVDTAFGVEEVDAFEHALVDGRAPHDREPQNRHEGRNEHDTHDELSNGAATRNTRDEHAHERRPGDPPTPVERRPAIEPGRTLIAIERQSLKAQRDEVLKVIANSRHEVTKQEQGWPQDQHDDEEDARENQVRVREELDALLEARGDREGRETRDDDDHDEAQPRVIGQQTEVHEPRGNLVHAEAERGCDTEEGADNGDRVNDVADPRIGVAAKDRLERPAHGERAAATVRCVRNGEAYDDVDAPRVQAPVKEHLRHSLRHAGRIGKLRDVRRRV